MEEVSRGPDYSIYRVKVQVHQVPDTDQYWCEVRAGPQVTPYPGPHEDQGGPRRQTSRRALPWGTRGFSVRGLSQAQPSGIWTFTPPHQLAGRAEAQASHLCWPSRGKHYSRLCILRLF